MKSDDLLRFEDVRQKSVLAEIDAFWDMKESYAEIGFIHKRGMLLFGPPGSGKSAMLKLVMEDCINRGNLVFVCESLGLLARALPSLREVEPDRQILVVLEDVDEQCGYNEHALLQMFDGDSTADNICYVATTNYLDRIPDRVKRPGRFDSKIEVGPPPAEGRRAFLDQKLGRIHQNDPALIERYVRETDGFSFGQLREFLVQIHCYKRDPSAAAKHLANGGFVFESLQRQQARDKQKEARWRKTFT